MIAAAVAGASVEISNVDPYLDDAGNIVQAKDGNILHDGNRWLIGMSYGLFNGCANSTVGACGFRLDHNISLYASDDLSSGSQKLLAKNILPVDARPSGIYFAPKVKFNQQTGKYVLWVNYLFEPQKVWV